MGWSVSQRRTLPLASDSAEQQQVKFIKNSKNKHWKNRKKKAKEKMKTRKKRVIMINCRINDSTNSPISKTTTTNIK